MSVEDEARPYRTPVYEPVDLVYSTRASVLAAELGLRVRPEPGTNTLALEGEAGRIVFVHGTNSMVVGGRPLASRDPIRVEGDDVPLSERDAAAVRTAWREAQRESRADHARPTAPAASRRPASAPGETAWKVPLTRHWEGILIHHSATDSGNLALFDKQHREVNGWDMVGYQFIICNGKGGPDGLVETTERWRRQLHGAHAGVGQKRFNDHWIGICLVGNFNQARPSPRQMASLRRLVRFLEDYCGIPDANIKGHKSVREAPTDCPGSRFPLHEILQDPPRAK
jgi:hypothetical protein